MAKKNHFGTDLGQIKWNNLDKNTRNFESSIFKKSIFKFIQPALNSVLTDLLNSICNCGTDIETTVHHLHHCLSFLDERLMLMNNIHNIDNNI